MDVINSFAIAIQTRPQLVDETILEFEQLHAALLRKVDAAIRQSLTRYIYSAVGACTQHL